MATVEINGHVLPSSKRGLRLVVTSLVDSGRNANGVVVGQKVGRDQYKLDGLEWPWLTAAEWSMILALLKPFYVNVKFPDPVTGEFITLKLYPGDRSATPYFLDDSGRPTHYKDCKVNLIDTGA